MTGYCMTSGAFLPLDYDLAEEVVKSIPEVIPRTGKRPQAFDYGDRDEAVLSARIIRKALK